MRFETREAAEAVADNYARERRVYTWAHQSGNGWLLVQSTRGGVAALGACGERFWLLLDW